MRALVVDEIASTRHFLCMCLSPFPNLEIQQASSTEEALQLLQNALFDLVVIDYEVPSEGAFGVLEQRNPRAAVVLGRSEDINVRQRAKGMGAQMVGKPVRAADMIETVCTLLGLDPAVDPESIERRVSPRGSIRVRVNVADQELSLESKDLSPMGAFLPSETLPPVGHVGMMVLDLAEPLDVKYRVVHVRPEPTGKGFDRGFAVQFEPDTSAQSAQLTRALIARWDAPPPDFSVRARLRRMPIFRELDYEEICKLEEMVEHIEIEDGTSVLREGDPSDAFYLVHTGQIRIFKADSELALLSAGDFFGEMGVVMNAPRSASAAAHGRASLYRISREDLLKFLRLNPGITEKIRATMVSRFNENVTASLR